MCGEGWRTDIGEQEEHRASAPPDTGAKPTTPGFGLGGRTYVVPSAHQEKPSTSNQFMRFNFYLPSSKTRPLIHKHRHYGFDSHRKCAAEAVPVGCRRAKGETSRGG